MKRAHFCTLVTAMLASLHLPIHAAPDARVLSVAEREKAPLLKTLEQVVGVESGSRDVEGLARAAELIAARLTELGGRVEQVPAGPETYRMADQGARGSGALDQPEEQQIRRTGAQDPQRQRGQPGRL